MNKMISKKIILKYSQQLQVKKKWGALGTIILEKVANVHVAAAAVFWTDKLEMYSLIQYCNLSNTNQNITFMNMYCVPHL